MRLPFWYYGGGCGRSSYLVLSRFLFHLQSPFLIVVSNLVLLLAPLKLLKFEGRKKKTRKKKAKEGYELSRDILCCFYFFLSPPPSKFEVIESALPFFPNATATSELHYSELAQK